MKNHPHLVISALSIAMFALLRPLRLPKKEPRCKRLRR